MPPDPKASIWVAGRIRPLAEAVVRADDSAFAEGRGCYTSIAIVGGRPLFAGRHIARLKRGARALRLGEVDAATLEKALAEVTEQVFSREDGIVRIQLSRSPNGPLQVTCVPRGLGVQHDEWTAISASIRHSGAVLTGGHKLTNRLVMALASDEAAAAGVDEALLFDHADRLVEASRCNLVVVAADGTPLTPSDSLGAVAGIALQVVQEATPELRPGEIGRDSLASASEIIALNSVRGARPIVRLDGRPVGNGRPGPFAKRLHETFLLRAGVSATTDT